MFIMSIIGKNIQPTLKCKHDIRNIYWLTVPTHRVKYILVYLMVTALLGLTNKEHHTKISHC